MNLNLEEQRYPEIRIMQRKKGHNDFDRNEFEQKVLLPFVNIRWLAFNTYIYKL